MNSKNAATILAALTGATVTIIAGFLSLKDKNPISVVVNLPPVTLVLNDTRNLQQETNPKSTTSILTPTTTPTPTSTDSPSATKLPSPKIQNFSACKSPCNGSNNIRTFPSGTTTIYAQWSFQDIPYGTEYIRSWSMNDNEWVNYVCKWDGKSSGIDSVELKEPMGFKAGTWTLSIFINKVLVLQEQIFIEGNNSYWDPAGTLNRCHW